MTTSDKAIALQVVSPLQPVCVSIGDPFQVTVRVLASNVDQCAIKIIFDETILEDVTEEPNPRQLGSGKIIEEVSWLLRARQETNLTDVVIEGRANGLFQKAQFFVEVTNHMRETQSLTYQEAGVDTEQQDRAMPLLGNWIERSFALRPGEVKLPLGYFANVVDIGNGIGLAVSTDGVGTKILIAQMLNKYNTIGIDCVAMNVNDVLCVGAEPVALLDYIAVEVPHPDLLGALAEGLYRGAELARVTIPGGEIAQVKEMIHGFRRDFAFDLVATCVGKVPLDRILTGAHIAEGDIIVGLRSSGIHSNGLTLARRVFFDQFGWAPDHYVEELGRTIGEELLEPTRIYVREVLEMINARLNIKALAHITSTGFLNLSRAEAPMGYILDALPAPHPIFHLIQKYGKVKDAEMYFTYNMGVGFCIVVAPEDADAIHAIAKKHNIRAHNIGFTIKDHEKAVRIPSLKLTGQGVGQSAKFRNQ
jgi:phosphoribosylformylglycinamidine cyclo-ligase